MTFLSSWAQSGSGLFRSAGVVKGGMGALTHALAESARGFGAEIRVPEEDVADSTCIEADPRTFEKRGEVDLLQFGTRHRSAYRLAAKRPGALVFVISQDRDLRVFYGRRDKPGEVCLWQSLGAWMAGATV